MAYTQRQLGPLEVVLAKLESSSDVDKKLDALHELNALMEQNLDYQSTPGVESFVLALTALAKTNNYPLVVAALVSATKLVGVAKERTRPQSTGMVRTAIARLADTKDRVRQEALVLLVKLMTLPGMIVAFDKDIKPAFSHKTPSVRESMVMWLDQMLTAKVAEVSLKEYWPLISKLLEDPVVSVRQQARELVIAVYRNNNTNVQQVLRKHLAPFKSSVVASLLTALDTIDASTVTSASPSPSQRQIPIASTPSASTLSPPLFQKQELIYDSSITPAKLNSERDVDVIFDKIMAAFKDPKETEGNWLARDAALDLFRTLLFSEFKRYETAMIPGIKRVIPPLLQSILSLRTQLSLKACRVSCDLFIVAAVMLDPPSIDQLTSAALKLCAQAKKLSALAGGELLETAIAAMSMPRLAAALITCLNDKNKDLRSIAANLFLIVLQHWSIQSLNRIGSDAIKEGLKKGLCDPQTNVREITRLSFWAFHHHFPSIADTFLNTLDASTIKLIRAAQPLFAGHPRRIYRVADQTSTKPVEKSPVTHQASLDLDLERNNIESSLDEALPPQQPHEDALLQDLSSHPDDLAPIPQPEEYLPPQEEHPQEEEEDIMQPEADLHQHQEENLQNQQDTIQEQQGEVQEQQEIQQADRNQQENCQEEDAIHEEEVVREGTIQADQQEEQYNIVQPDQPADQQQQQQQQQQQEQEQEQEQEQHQHHQHQEFEHQQEEQNDSVVDEPISHEDDMTSAQETQISMLDEDQKSFETPLMHEMYSTSSLATLMTKLKQFQINVDDLRRWQRLLCQQSGDVIQHIDVIIAAMITLMTSPSVSSNVQANALSLTGELFESMPCIDTATLVAMLRHLFELENNRENLSFEVRYELGQSLTRLLSCHDAIAAWPLLIEYNAIRYLPLLLTQLSPSDFDSDLIKDLNQMFAQAWLSSEGIDRKAVIDCLVALHSDVFAQLTFVQPIHRKLMNL